MIQLEWVARVRPTVFHAAAALCAGQRPLELELPESVRVGCQQAAGYLLAKGIQPRNFWSQLIVLSAPNDPVSVIVTTALRKLRGLADAQSLVGDSFAGDVSTIVQQAIPHLIQPAELEIRGEPLRQQWEAFGPGLLRLIASCTSADLMVPQCRVLLVQPLLAGVGAAHLDYNAVHVEAMLVNADERLPEVVRLAWLVAQLNHDLPKYSERIPRDRLATIGGLAMLPATLCAAEQLGLARFDRATRLAAVQQWLSPAFHEVLLSDQEQLVSMIENWWEVCTSGNHAWPAALAALDQMIS